MSEVNELLLWARGPAFDWALMIMIFGVIVRLIEIFSLGRRTDLAVARTTTPGSGWRTMRTRSFKLRVLSPRTAVTYYGGFVFHIGLAVTILFLVPHIEVWQSLFKIGWPGLPTSMIDFVAVITMLAMLILLVDRLTNKVKKQLSGFSDYLVWFVTFLPLLTGYLTYHHLGLPYTMMLAIHILSVELLMVVLPFTKLIHTFTIFPARWYNGDQFARKGVES